MHIPLAALAGILIVVAWNMSEIHAFLSILRSNRYDIAVLLATFFLTIFFDLILAIEIGMVLAAFLFMKRMGDGLQLNPILGDEGEEALFENEGGALPTGVAVFQINGPLFFGAAQRFYDAMNEVGSHYQYLILRMRYVPLIDATGLQRLKEILKEMKERKVHVIFSGVNEVIRDEILATGMVNSEDIYTSYVEALLHVRHQLEGVDQTRKTT
jgi:SulP family sulfate permease